MVQRKKRSRNFIMSLIRLHIETEIPLASMIDIVFLLLIYFVLNQKPIIDDTLLGVNIAPPQSASSPKQLPSTFFCVELNKGSEENNISLNGQECDFEQLRSVLKDAVQNDPQAVVMIKCDQQVKHAKLIRLLDLCKSTNISRISLADAG